MKDIKLISAIISVIALGACTSGGDSISGGTHPRDRLAVTDSAATSNRDITSMTSEILFSSSGTGTARSAIRSGSIVQDGQVYTSYRLDDVTFKMGGEDSRIIFNVDNEGRIVSLGKYDRSDDFSGEPTYAISEEGVFARKGTDGNEFGKILYMYNISGSDLDYTTGVDPIASSHFNEGIEFMNDNGALTTNEIKDALKAKLRKEINKIKASQKDDPNDETLHAAYLENIEKLDNAYAIYAARIDAMESFAPANAAQADLTVKGVNIGLKYADLGFAELTARANVGTPEEEVLEHTFTPYVGGYDVLKIDQEDLDSDRVFTGTAIAGIDHKKKGYTDGTNIEEGVLVRQNDATLTLRTNGTSTLIMNNLVNQANADQHWYAVQVDQDTDGLPTFTITGTNTITGEKEGVAAYNLPDADHLVGVGNATTFTADQWEPHEQHYVTHTDNNNRVSGNYENSLYRLGDDNEHAEATALFGFGNEYHSNDNVQHNEVAIYGAFGSGTSATVEP